MSNTGRFWIKKSKKRAHDGPERAAILCRQSLMRKESISLEDQELRNRTYADAHGYAVVDVRHSPNVRGWRDDRADHNHFRALAAAGEIDLVISYDVARTARTMRLMEQFAHDLETVGVRLEFSSQPMANDPMGRQMITMMAEMETAARSVKLTDTFGTLRRRGQWHGSAPFGYARRARTIVPDETEAPIAKMIFARALRGTGTVSLRDALNAEGIPTRTGATWDETMLSRMLRNPAYAGGMVFDGEAVWPSDGCTNRPGSGTEERQNLPEPSEKVARGETWHEPLIERADWDHLQAILPTFARVRSKPATSWCEGMVEHACGERMYLIVTRTPRDDEMRVYRCRMRGKSPRCRLAHVAVSARNLETAARRAVVAALANPPDPEAVIRDAVESQKRDGSLDVRRSIAKRREKLAGMKRAAAWNQVNHPKMAAEFAAIASDLDAQLAALVAEEAAIPEAVPASDIRAVAVAVRGLAQIADRIADDDLALGVRTLGGRFVVGDGGVWVAFPPEVARVLAPPVPVKIPRARTVDKRRLG